MAIVGYQDFWVAGSRAYFKKDAVEAVEQPLLDLGVLDSATPTIEPTNVQLYDADGGLKVLVDQALTQFGESYDLVLRNLNLNNLALLYVANTPSAFTQTAEQNAVSHYAHPGHLLKIKDSTDTFLYALSHVIAVYTDGATLSATSAITAIVKATKTITMTLNTITVAAANKIFINSTGLANVKNAKTYTVVSVTGAGPYSVVVEEEPEADETAISGTLQKVTSGTLYDPTDDWETVSAERGIIRMIDGGAFAAAANVTVLFYKRAVTGDRLINPQSLSGVVQGTMMLVWSRGQNAQQTVREVRVSLTPAGLNVSAEDFSSLTLKATVLNDLTADEPAGRIIYPTGSLPAKS